MTRFQKQLRFLNWEFGVFFHFGIRTFYEGHTDWDMKEMPAQGFTPDRLQCDGWIKTAKEAGARYAILVCKHHDGFANWPTKYSDYSVAATPWKNGKGDVVREFTDACRKYGLGVGLYYSPAQFGSVKMNAKEYDDYFINQVSELLGLYGKLDYLWFDGCGSENHEYDTERIVKEIRRLQPDIMLFNMWDPDTRWIGNEAGVADLNNPLTVDRLDFSVLTTNKDRLKEALFLPAECDCRIRKQWFYSDADRTRLKSLEQLKGMYLSSVGRGANLLLNVGPDRHGEILKEDADRLREFGDWLKSTFETPIKKVENPELSDGVFTLSMDEETPVNYVVLQEELSKDRAVTSFEIQLSPQDFGENVTVYLGKTIGHKAICPLPSLCGRSITVKINGTNQPKLESIALF